MTFNQSQLSTYINNIQAMFLPPYHAKLEGYILIWGTNKIEQKCSLIIIIRWIIRTWSTKMLELLQVQYYSTTLNYIIQRCYNINRLAHLDIPHTYHTLFIGMYTTTYQPYRLMLVFHASMGWKVQLHPMSWGTTTINSKNHRPLFYYQAHKIVKLTPF